jgi:phosphoglycolate phosphatase
VVLETRPSVILYDWDNTLVDAWAGVAAALNAAFTAFGKPIWTVAETRARVRVSLRDSFPAMFGANWERAAELFYATLARAHLAHVRPLPGAAEVLAIGAAWPQAVVSNKTGRFLRAEVEHLGWSRLFHSVVGAGDAAADKPSADPLLLALAAARRPADSSVWFCGDTGTDMQAARAAGVTAVLIGDAADDGGPDVVKPDLIFSDCHALAAHLSTLA